MSSTVNGAGLKENIETGIAKTNNFLKPVLCIMVAFILVMVIIMVYHHFSVHHPKVVLPKEEEQPPKQEGFARLVNQQMLREGHDYSVHSRIAPRSDRIGNTYWNRFKTNVDMTGKVLKAFNDQYKKKFGMDSCKFITDRIAKYMEGKEVTEVVNKQTQKVEDVVITEKGSDIIDTKVEITEDHKIVATEPIVEPTTQEVIAEEKEVIGEVAPEVEVPASTPENHVAEPVAEEQKTSTSSSTEQKLVEPTKAEDVVSPAEVSNPDGYEKDETVPTVDTTGVVPSEVAAAEGAAAQQTPAQTEQWTPSRALNKHAFAQLTWNSSAMNSNAFSLDTPKPKFSTEAYGRMDYQKRNFF